MPVLAPGSTRKVPPQSDVSAPSARVIAAFRSEPGVWAVPASNSGGLTTRMGGNFDMGPRHLENRCPRRCVALLRAAPCGKLGIRHARHAEHQDALDMADYRLRAIIVRLRTIQTGPPSMT